MHCERPQGWITVKCKHDWKFQMGLRCRTCPSCREVRRQEHVRRTLYGWEQMGRPGLAVLTLTTRSGAAKPEWREITRWWSSMLKALRKENPALMVVKVKEEGKESGMRHLHIILFHWRYVAWKKLVAMWELRSGARGVYIRRCSGVDIGKALFYISKYIGKGLASGGKRLIDYSRGWARESKAESLSLEAFDSEPTIEKTGTWVGWGGFLDTFGRGTIEYCGCFGSVKAPT